MFEVRLRETLFLNKVRTTIGEPLALFGRIETVNTTDKPELQYAHSLLDRVTADQVIVAVRFLEFLLIDPQYRAFATAPVDDEPVTAEDEAAVLRSEAWFKQNVGKGIPMEEVLADFGLTMDDFPLKLHGA